ncbi:MAG: hypothetical protein M3291_14025 [Actinomycetota bacterium]|nr:hypothetical protein [Actinomycetota bacterium]
MPDAPTDEQLLALVGELSARMAEQDRVIVVQADRIAELQRRSGRIRRTPRGPVGGCTVGHDAGEEVVVADPVRAQPGQAAWGGVGVAVAGRGSGSGGGARTGWRR